MAERGYLEMVWNRVLCGAELRASTAGKRAVVLELVSPAFQTQLGTEAVFVELRTAAPLVCAPLEPDGALIPLATLHETHALTISAPVVDDPHTLLLRATPRLSPGDPWSVVSLCLDGELGTIRTETGKALSQMKLASVAQKEMFAEQGIVDVAGLNARKEEALETIRPLLKQAGFTDGKSFWIRRSAAVTQAIELVNSRWNTFGMVSFHFEFRVRLGGPNEHGIENKAALHDVARPTVVRTSSELSGRRAYAPFAITQTTSVSEIAAELRTELQSRYLPWLDAMTDVDAIVRYLNAEHPSKNDCLCGLFLACSGRTDEARPFLSRAPIAPEALRATLRNYGVDLG